MLRLLSQHNITSLSTRVLQLGSRVSVQGTPISSSTPLRCAVSRVQQLQVAAQGLGASRIRQAQRDEAQQVNDGTIVSSTKEDKKVKEKKKKGVASGKSAGDSSPTSAHHLTPEQASAFQNVIDGRNTFLTGKAGTGKTYLLREIEKFFRDKYGLAYGFKVAMTAMTGTAATHLSGGRTLHSVLGVSKPKLVTDFLHFMRLNRAALRDLELRLSITYNALRDYFCARRIPSLFPDAVLVIDEASMLSAEFLRHMNAALQKIRGNSLPMGGIQVIICGDMMQLPPIEGNEDEAGTDIFLNEGLAFLDPVWTELNMQHTVLKKVHRQSDRAFVEKLDLFRHGTLEDVMAVWDELRNSCTGPLRVKEGGMKPIHLCSKNRQVNKINEDGLAKLTTPLITYGRSYKAITIVKSQRIPASNETAREVTVKVGAQVMLNHNLDVAKKLVNGSSGVVIDMVDSSSFLADMCQEISSMIRIGVYSRARGISMLDEDIIKKVGRAEMRMYQEWCDKHTQVPVVKFRYKKKERTQVIGPVCTVERRYGIADQASGSTTPVPKGESCLVKVEMFMQVPLQLNWALTIHKSQGMTLEPVVVDVDGIFAPGQLYTALSRATGLDQLHILGDELTSRAASMNSTAQQFYKAMEGGDTELRTFLKQQHKLWQEKLQQRLA